MNKRFSSKVSVARLLHRLPLMLLAALIGLTQPLDVQARPTAPLPSLAAEASGSKIDLTWAFGSSRTPDGTVIERSTLASSGFKAVGSVSGSSSSWSDVNIQPASTYYYRVRTFEKSRSRTYYSSYSNIAFATGPVEPSIDISPPDVSIVQPISGSVINSTASIQITAAATDDRGVSRVDFFKGSVLMGTATSPPYAYAWRAGVEDNGNHSFYAKAYDSAGNSRVSNPVTISVQIPQPAPGSFEFSASDYSVGEGDGQVAVTIRRVGGSDGSVTVDWRTVGISATFDQDYGSFNWTPLTFAPGETSKTLPISIVQDPLVEGDEAFEVRLSNPTGGATLGGITTSPVTIADDDQAVPVPGAFEFSSSAYSVGEGDGQVAVTIRRVGGSDGTVTVDWRTVGTSATFDQDYGSFNWTPLTFAPGETSKTLPISIVQDALVEGDEAFEVRLSNPTGGATLGGITTSPVTIADDDREAPAPPPADDGPLKVFPGAEGFGIDTPAGRGGQVIKVTNLNDSGAGSLRAAIQASGPRTVVFEVSGTINLNSPIYIDNPFLTVAGQTAPSPGITIRNGYLIVRTHDILLRHLRIRTGDIGSDVTAIQGRDGVTLMYYPNKGVIYNVVIDHCSLSWGIDENLDINYDSDNITVSNSIISEGLHDSYNKKGPHSKGVLISSGSDNVALIKNLFAHNDDRHPNINGSSTGIISANNLWYNAGSRWVSISDPYLLGPVVYTDVNNHYIDGPDTTLSATGCLYYIHNSLPAGTKIYVKDTRYDGKGIYMRNLAPASYIVNTPPVWDDSIRVLPTDSVEGYVLINAGARPADRDAVDARVVGEVTNRTGSIIDTPGQVGGWPNLPVNQRTFVVPANPNGDDDGDGYTNLEEILNQMAAVVEGR